MAASGAGQSERANFTFPMWLALTSSVAVALLLIILVWNVELKRQVKRHTSELTHRNEENAFLCEKLQQYANDLERRVIQRTEELTEANRDLHEAKEAAEDADRIKSAFLATMSHELRTPLNSIIGFTGILLQGLAGPLNTEQRKQLDMVRTSSRHLLSLINDVLDIQLPSMDGYAVAQKLRGNPALSQTPIVAVTSYAMPGDRERAIASGCNGYIEKPINPETFVSEIEHYLGLAQKEPLPS